MSAIVTAWTYWVGVFWPAAELIEAYDNWYYNVFFQMVELNQNIIEFFENVYDIFTYVPATFWIVLSVGLIISIVLRIVGR